MCNTADNDKALQDHDRALKQQLETEKARLDREHQHSVKSYKDELDAKLSKAKAEASAASEEELQLLKQTVGSHYGCVKKAAPRSSAVGHEQSAKRQQLEQDLKKLQGEHDTQVRLLDQARSALDEDKASLKTER